MSKQGIPKKEEVFFEVIRMPDKNKGKIKAKTSVKKEFIGSKGE